MSSDECIVTDRSIEAVLAYEDKIWNFIEDVSESGGTVMERDTERWIAAHKLVIAVTDYLNRAKSE